jgi:hypothetical protein
MIPVFKIGIICISLYHDDELLSTIQSIHSSPLSSSRDRLLSPLIIKIIADKSHSKLTSESAISYAPSMSDPSSIVLVGLDSGLYDAMNIGVRHALASNCSHVLFINSGVYISDSFDIELLVDAIVRNPRSIIFSNATELIPVSGSFDRSRVWRVNLQAWLSDPISMPACHHSIIYPLALLANMPYVNISNFLVADYLNLLQLLQSGASFQSINTILSVYVNNGLSARSFHKSIAQRAIAYFLIYSRPFKSLQIYTISLLRHSFAKLLGLR